MLFLGLGDLHAGQSLARKVRVREVATVFARAGLSRRSTARGTNRGQRWIIHSLTPMLTIADDGREAE